MIKILAFAIFVIGQLHSPLGAFRHIVGGVRDILIQVCDNVDPGDEDGYE